MHLNRRFALVAFLLAAASFSTVAQEPPATELPNYIPPGYSGKPCSDVIRSIPGLIQAEQYDVAPGGSNDISFHYTG
jgi:hypothetical protein